MRTVVTTREFDEQGRCIRETVCEYEAPPSPLPAPRYDPPLQWWQSPVTTPGSITLTTAGDVQLYN